MVREFHHFDRIVVEEILVRLAEIFIAYFHPNPIGMKPSNG